MQALTFFFAFVAVLALIGAAAWLLRRFAGNRLSTNTNRGRGPRLAVIDAAAVDGRRRLVLVRRDNVEHLLMIGGPTDIVVEPNIVRATPARDQMAQRPAIGSEPPPRIAPLPDGNWSDVEGARSDAFDHAEPQLPEPPQQLPRSPFADEVRRSAPPRLERRGDPLCGLLAGTDRAAPGTARLPTHRAKAAAHRADAPAPGTSGGREAAADPRRTSRRITAVSTPGAATRARSNAVERGSKPRRDGAAARSSAAPTVRAGRTARRRAAGRARAAGPQRLARRTVDRAAR